MAYALMILTTLLALAGIIMKSKQDEKPGIFNRISVGGLLIVALMLISFVFNIVYQQQKDDAVDAQRLLSYKDSLLKNERYRNDSLMQASTIEKLNQQLLNDSALMTTTNRNFGQSFFEFYRNLERQEIILTKQEQLQRRAEDIQHPISPLQVFVSLEVQITDSFVLNWLREDLANFGPGLNNTVFNHTPNRNSTNYPSTVLADPKWWGVGRVDYDNYSPFDTCTYDSSFMDFNGVLFEMVLPMINFYFFKNNSLPVVDPEQADFYFYFSRLPYDDPSNRIHVPCGYPADTRISYCYMGDGTVYYWISFSNPHLEVKRHSLTSMNELRNGFLAVATFEDTDEPVEIKTVEFRCGPGFFDRYFLVFEEKDTIPQTRGALFTPKIYIKTGPDVLADRNIGTIVPH